MFYSLMRLIKLRLLNTKNGIIIAFTDTRELAKLLFFFCFAVIFVAGGYYFFFRIFSALAGQEEAGAFLMSKFINMVFLTLLTMLLYSNIITAVSTIFLSSDLDALLTTPLPVTSIFIYKFGQTLFKSSYMFIIFFLPAFAAYGVVMGAGALYYILLLPVLVIFTVAPTGIGILLTMILMRFFPARRVQQFFFFLGLVFASVFVLYFRLLKPEELFNNVTPTTMLALIDNFNVPMNPYVPNTWATKYVELAAIGQWGGALQQGLLIFIAGAGVLIIATVLAARIYFSGWANAGVTLQAAVKRSFLLDNVVPRLLLPFSAQTRALIIKDMKVFTREISQWSQLFMLVPIVLLYIFNFTVLPADQVRPIRPLLAALNFSVASFVLSAVALRIIFPTTSLEGQSFYMIKTAPITPRRFLWEKFFLTAPALLILSEAIIIGSNWAIGIHGVIMHLTILLTAGVTLALIGLGVGLGASYPRFKFENPMEIALGAGGIIYMLFSFIIILINITVGLIFIAKILFNWFGWYQDWNPPIYLNVAAVLIFDLLVMILPMIRGERDLAKMEVH